MGTGKEGGRNKEEGRKANVNARVAARVQLYFLNYLHHALIQPNPKKKAVVPASSSSAQCSLTPAGGRQAGRQAGRQTDPHSIWNNVPLVPRGINSATEGDGLLSPSMRHACLLPGRRRLGTHHSSRDGRTDAEGRTDGTTRHRGGSEAIFFPTKTGWRGNLRSHAPRGRLSKALSE